MNRNTTLSCSIQLPPDYRQSDFLAFHRRDALMIAERVDDQSLRKGLIWAGSPACLQIEFAGHEALASLDIDGEKSAGNPTSMVQMVRRMLGLTQVIDEFESLYRSHPQIGALIAATPGLRVPQTATPFEALTWAITGQQISVSAAVSVRRKFIMAAGLLHSSGIWCYPDARRVAAMALDDLRQAGFSQTKAQTLRALSKLVEERLLPLDSWAEHPPVDEIRAQLSKVRGIGPWTINYTLLRGFGWLDGSLHGDAAVRRKLQLMLGAEEKLSEVFVHKWLAEFSPWRALVAAHLWTMAAGGRIQG